MQPGMQHAYNAYSQQLPYEGMPFHGVTHPMPVQQIYTMQQQQQQAYTIQQQQQAHMQYASEYHAAQEYAYSQQQGQASVPAASSGVGYVGFPYNQEQHGQYSVPEAAANFVGNEVRPHDNNIGLPLGVPNIGNNAMKRRASGKVEPETGISA